jgi:hypothetical protein
MMLTFRFAFGQDLSVSCLAARGCGSEPARLFVDPIPGLLA